jgi:hypothetical protein
MRVSLAVATLVDWVRRWLLCCSEHKQDKQKDQNVNSVCSTHNIRLSMEQQATLASFLFLPAAFECWGFLVVGHEPALLGNHRDEHGAVASDQTPEVDRERRS